MNSKDTSFSNSSMQAERARLKNGIFSISHAGKFNELALDVFRYQFTYNNVYQNWCRLLGRTPKEVHSLEAIPFLPISFFKQHQIVSGSSGTFDCIFRSSATTGQTTSQHFVIDKHIYNNSILEGFTQRFGSPESYTIVGLLPSYLERNDASLVYMTEYLIRLSADPQSGFFLNNYDALYELLASRKHGDRPVWLIGVSFALLDFAKLQPPVLEELIVVETGGMKGRRREMVRDELHEEIRKHWPLGKIDSEYGMTELLSQAWTAPNGRFICPPWMQVRIRANDNPLEYVSVGKTGAINVIDLANIDSCAFIETSDLGKAYADDSFEVLGRFDQAEIRGCNLMVV
jgi:hypothetical protein